jgi:hypothetical protein
MARKDYSEEFRGCLPRHVGRLGDALGTGSTTAPITTPRPSRKPDSLSGQNRWRRGLSCWKPGLPIRPVGSGDVNPHIRITNPYQCDPDTGEEDRRPDDQTLTLTPSTAYWALPMRPERPRPASGFLSS